MESILEISELSKYYPGVVALDRVSMTVMPGEVHALIGENGAGKSTLIKAIAGAITTNGGYIRIADKTFTELDPLTALENGVTVIYQEFNLVPSISVAENIFLGIKVGGRHMPDFSEMHRRSKEIFEKFNIDIDTRRQVAGMTTGQMQMVEIAKAISRNAKILIMDEPTASLSTSEVQSLFRIIRQLKESGVTIIYISHRLDELFEISDRVTVLRDGKYIATLNTAETNRQQLVSLMVGRELVETHPARSVTPGEVVLSTEKLTGNGVSDISISLHRGEILGLGGLVGAGRTELAKLIYGAAKIESGELKVKGEVVYLGDPGDSIKNGIGLIPEDRKNEGALLDFSIDWNISLMCLKQYSRFGIIDRKAVGEVTKKYFKELSIIAPSEKQLVKNLSGGNQQKVVLAKVLAAQTEIIIFDEPTRGIDVGAKQEIYNLMNELTAQGKSIIMISSDMEELLGMSDRIIVMHEGRYAGEIKKEYFSQDRVLALASGLSDGRQENEERF